MLFRAQMCRGGNVAVKQKKRASAARFDGIAALETVNYSPGTAPLNMRRLIEMRLPKTWAGLGVRCERRCGLFQVSPGQPRAMSPRCP